MWREAEGRRARGAISGARQGMEAESIKNWFGIDSRKEVAIPRLGRGL